MNEKLPTYQPHGLEDLGWRIGYRIRRGLFHVFGPPTLNERNDPHKKLERERAARYAAKAEALAAQHCPGTPSLTLGG